MKLWRFILGSLMWSGVVLAEHFQLGPDNPRQCSGMYSKSAWGGTVVPLPVIITKFSRYRSTGLDGPTGDPVVALVIFEWEDRNLIGLPGNSDADEIQYVCDDAAIKNGLCEEADLGTFLLAPNATNVWKNKIITQPVWLGREDRGASNYGIEHTGYYCVFTVALGDFNYAGDAEFINAYGELSGAQIPKLPFYGGLSIVYALMGFMWAFLYVQHRHSILPLQQYITGIFVFLVIEMVMTWGYYDYMNRHGSDTGAKALMVAVSVLNAARNSFSFFLLLIVCMGYGVVKPELGRTMLFVRGLAVTYFVFGVIYAVASLTIQPEDAGPLLLFVVLPLAGCLTAFYVWTLNALGATMKDLAQRKQRVKAQMYKKLWWCILTSIVVIFGFFFVNSFAFAGQSDPDFTPDHWQTRWFVLDGWLNLVYLVDVAFIAYVWRPTANNRRFAMSDEISQDDEGFEIASVRDSLDEDEEAGNRPPGYSAATPTTNGGANLKVPKPSKTGDGSPLPAPIPQRPMGTLGPTRESLDGETIFAVGEDGDRFSDDEADVGPTKGLTRKNS